MAKDLWKDAEHQLKELDMDLEDEGGNNPWDAAAGQEVRHRRPEAFFFFLAPAPELFANDGFPFSLLLLTRGVDY